jgi:uncharacterized protein (DUF433 family)
MKNAKKTINDGSQLLGRYIVADPKVRHGKPTFRGTRIMVWQVLEQVASGVAWETIVEEWEGKICPDAISEAVKLAGQAFHDHAAEYLLEATTGRSSWTSTSHPVSDSSWAVGTSLCSTLGMMPGTNASRMKTSFPFRNTSGVLRS